MKLIGERFTGDSVDTEVEVDTGEEQVFSAENTEGTIEQQDECEPEGTLDQEVRRTYINGVTERSRDLWSNLSPRGRQVCMAAGGLAASAAIAFGGMQLGQNNEENHSETPENSNPTTEEEVSGINESEAFLGNSGFNNHEIIGLNETEEPQKESEITDEGNYKETITQPDGVKIIKEWYSPYSFTETVSHPGEDSESQETYQEASHEPLAPINHPIYEHITGTDYEEFLENVKNMTPELKGNPYDAEDVLESFYKRRAAASNQMDPRYIETLNTPGSKYYRMSHTAFKQAFEEDGNPLPAIEQYEIEFDTIARKETFSGDIFKDTSDFNVSRTHTFTANYEIKITYRNRADDTIEEVDSGEKQAKFTRQSIPDIPETSNNGMFLMEEEQKLPGE